LILKKEIKTMTTPTANDQPRKKQLSFKKFLVSKRRQQILARKAKSTKAARSRLTEQNISYAADYDIGNSMFASIPAKAPDRDVAIGLIANKLGEMTETMDVVLTCVCFDPAQSRN
jgi:hypothetical protein